MGEEIGGVWARGGEGAVLGSGDRWTEGNHSSSYHWRIKNMDVSHFTV